MREIKFRAWNSIVMVYQDFPKGGLTAGEILKRFDNVMQFTGLKDKNGKEIYEGDIVGSKLYDGTKKNYVVEFKDGSFVVGLTELGKWIEDVIVIGNIYENPELLAPKE